VHVIGTYLKSLDVGLLPDSELQALVNHLRQIADQVKLMMAFTVEQNNAPGVRDSIITHIHSYTDQLYTTAQGRIPFLALQRGDVKRNEQEVAESVTQIRTLLGGLKKDVTERKGEIDGIITAAREASATVGVAHFTADFKTTADQMGTAASTWLWRTTIAGALTIAAALAFPFVFPVEGTALTLHAVQIFTSKLVVLGALFAATLWCGRMFKASKHMEAVNRHRENALRTFQAFTKAASDDQTRNAVLLETTRSIFALANPGYLDGTETGSEGALQVLEVVKSAAGGGK
jgi:hypothetical protein